MKKEDLRQFQYDYEEKQYVCFDELEGLINEVDLSDKTKQWLIDIMYKDINRLFGFVEERINNLVEILGDKEND